MAEMMRRADDQSRLDSVRTVMVKAQTSPNSERIVDATMLRLIESARRRADLKLEYLASLAGVKLSTLSGALNGHAGFNVCWLWAWPVEFWNEFLPLLRAAKETSEDARRQQRRARLIQLVEILLSEVA